MLSTVICFCNNACLLGDDALYIKVIQPKFLIPYFLFIVVIGFTGVIGEMAFGRAMGTGPLGAFRKASQMRGGNWGEWIGIIPVIGSLGIATGYSVVVGWIIRFLAGSVTGSAFTEESGEYFGALAQNFGSVLWHVIGLGIVFICMAYGISTGIEKINKIMMPIFFILFNYNQSSSLIRERNFG